MKTILFFIECTRNACAEQLEGIYRFAHQVSWHVQLVECGQRAVNAARILAEWSPVGAIVEYPAVVSGFVKVSDFAKTPVVYLDYDPQFGRTHHMVAPDPDVVAQLAMRELLTLEFRHYAFVPFPVPYYWSNRRGAAFRRIVRGVGKTGHVFDRTGPVSLGDWIRDLPKPCGVFAANDRVSEEVLSAALLNGLHVPDDLAVIGVDGDEKICMNARPPLSSVQLDFIQAGYLAASKLRDLALGRLGRSGLWTFEPLRVIRRRSTTLTRRCSPESLPDVRRILSFLHESAGSGITVADVATFVGRSRRSVEQSFRRKTGQTVLSAIHDAIYARACELAANRHVRTPHVPDLLGGVSRDTLDRIFVKRTGKTFRAWRESSRVIAELSH